MRILHVVRGIGQGGGAGGVALHVMSALERRGHESVVITARSLGIQRRFDRGSLGKVALIVEVVSFTALAYLRGRHLRRSGAVDVVLGHSDALYADVYVNHGILRSSLRDQGPLIRSLVRNPLHAFLLAREAIRWRTERYASVVCLSDTERDLLNSEYAVDRSRIAVVPNGVDLARFQRHDLMREEVGADLRGSSGATTCLFVGHEFDRKGLEIVLRALILVAPSIRLVVVGGDNSMVRSHRAVCEALGLHERVSFVGKVADPSLYFAAADVFVLPSRYEAAALVLMEALAAGLPIITTAMGSGPSLLADGAPGTIVERSPESVAAAISLWERELSSNGADIRERCQRAAARYSWDAIGERYEDLLSAVIRSEKPQV